VLANALVCVALVAIAANAMLSAGLVSERIAVRRIAQEYAAQEYGNALDRLVSDVEDYARGGAFPSPLPELSPIPAHCADPDPPCAFSGSATLTVLRRDPATPVPCGTDSACAANEETNRYVNEGRIVARVSIDVRSADGTVLAQREHDVTLRTFSTAPYVAIAGAADLTGDTTPGQAPRGEDAGAIPVTPNPCTPASPGQAGDTVVRVAYENAQTGACLDGSSWRTSGY
jgi:hypothetical protein